jgi:hypothetical protein
VLLGEEKTMKRTLLILAGIVVTASGSGCATIVSGRDQNIHITSNPPGVRVKADTGVEVTTPGSLKLPRNRPHTLVAEYAGAQPQQKDLQSGLNGWIFGNILIGGIIGVVIDIASGAYGDLSPATACFDFTPVGQAAEQRKREYLASHPDLRENVRCAILYERPLYGMKKDELVAALGDPDEVVQAGKSEKYVYESRDPKYYFVRDDRIQRIERK